MSAAHLKVVTDGFDLNAAFGMLEAKSERAAADASCDLRQVLHVVASPPPEPAPAAPASPPAAPDATPAPAPAPASAQPAEAKPARKKTTADLLVDLAKEHNAEVCLVGAEVAVEFDLDGKRMALPLESKEFSACLRAWYAERHGGSVTNGPIKTACDTIAAGQVRLALAALPVPVEPQPAPEVQEQRDEAALAALRAMAKLLRPAAGSEVVVRFIEHRKIDPGLVTDLYLGGALPPLDACATFGDFATGGTADGVPGNWWATNHLYITLLHSVEDDSVVSARARYCGTKKIEAAQKSLGPKGCPVAGAWMRSELVGAYVRGEATAPKIWAICEGEMDFAAVSVALHRLGRADVGVVGIVSGSWTQACADKIPAGATVILLTHSDRAGCIYRDKIARSLGKRRLMVRHLFSSGDHKLPDENDRLKMLGEKYDPIKGLHKWTAPPSVWPLTDSGNGERIIHRHGGDLRYLLETEQWLRWDGVRWEVGNAGKADAERRALETARSAMQTEAPATPEERQALGRWALLSESDSAIDRAVNRARVAPEIQVRQDDLDANPFVLNTPGGALDLVHRTVDPCARDLLLTKVAGVEYDPDEPAPTWERVVGEIFEGNPEVIRYFHKLVGYTLSGDTREKILIFLHGAGGNNGKSLLMDALVQVFGEYAGTFKADMIFDRSKDKHTTDLTDLRGVRLAIVNEIDEGARLTVGIAKTIAGGTDRMTANRMRQDNKTFRQSAKLWIPVNDPPVIPANKPAIWNRVRIIPFNQTFAITEEGLALPDKLKEEKKGILAWAVRGFAMYQQEGLKPPPEVLARGAEVRQQGDAVRRFLDDECEVGTDLSIPSTELYDAYVLWHEQSGERSPRLAQWQLGADLERRGFTSEMSGPKKRRYRAWCGLKLSTDLKPKPGSKHLALPQQDDRTSLLKLIP